MAADYAVVIAGVVGMTLSIDMPFTLNGIQHPDNWLRLSTAQERVAINIFPVSHVGPPDQRWYSISGEDFAWNDGTKTVDATWSFAARSLTEVKAVQIGAVSSYRQTIEVSGMTMNGELFATTEGARNQIAAYAELYRRGLQLSFNVTTKGGSLATLGGTNAVILSDAMGAFVTACGDNQRAHANAIAALDDWDDVIEYDLTTGWPSNVVTPGQSNYVAMIKRRAEKLQRAGRLAEAILLLKTIGE